jgi:hypothetical protein
VLVAVGRSIVDEGRRHPVLTLRAVALVSVVYCLVLAVTIFTYGLLFGYLYPQSRWLDAFFPVELVPALFAGWTLARTHRACIEPAIVIILVLYTLLAGPFHASDIATNVIGFLAGVWGGVRRHERPAQKGTG